MLLPTPMLLAGRSSMHQSATHQHQAFPYTQCIRRFAPTAQVMKSKEKPKKISVDSSDGSTVNFLCKRESSGDLRKDARLMEFNFVINRLLRQDGDGRRRKLKLRTYAVICINEETGLLQWVENTMALRSMLTNTSKLRGCQPYRLTREGKAAFEQAQRDMGPYAHDRVCG